MKRRRSKITHRTHPAKVFPPPPGFCHWCHVDLTLVEKPRHNKKFCGRLCEDMYRIHTDPKVWRKEVWLQDRGICRECGTKHPVDGDWEADHIVPLFIAGLDWNWWSVQNGQVLCRDPCHKVKSSNDAVRYATDAPKKRKRRRYERY